MQWPKTTTILFMLTDHESGIWTGHSRVAGVCSTVSGGLSWEDVNGQRWLKKLGAEIIWRLPHSHVWRLGWITQRLGSAGPVNLSPDTWHLHGVQASRSMELGLRRSIQRENISREPRGKLHSLFWPSLRNYKALFSSIGWSRYKPAQIQGEGELNPTPPWR